MVVCPMTDPLPDGSSDAEVADDAQEAPLSPIELKKPRPAATSPGPGPETPPATDRQFCLAPRLANTRTDRAEGPARRTRGPLAAPAMIATTELGRNDRL